MTPHTFQVVRKSGRRDFGSLHESVINVIWIDASGIDLPFYARIHPMKISIIIPCLNSAEFIGKCLDSILIQGVDSSEFEIIIVDDGSSDDTKKIARDHLAKADFKNVKIIDSNHAGPGGARNSGMKEALGDYIWFVDSDDSILEGSLASIMSQTQGCNVDVFWFDHIEVDVKSGALIKNKMDGKEGYSEKLMPGSDFLKENFSGSCMVWAFVFKRSFLERNALNFANNIYFEDILFVFKVIDLASSVKFLKISAYQYNLRPGSIMRSEENSKKRLRDALFVNEELKRISEKSNSKNFLESYLTRSSCWVLRVSAKMGNDFFGEQIRFAKEVGLIKLPYAGKLSDLIQAVLINHWGGGFYLAARRILK